MEWRDVPFAHHILLPTFPPPEGRLQERVGMHSGFSLQKGRAASFIICSGCLNEGKNRNWLKGNPRPASPQAGFGSRLGRVMLGGVA